MTHSIAHRLRVAILPFAALVVVACGGGAAVTQGLTETDGRRERTRRDVRRRRGRLVACTCRRPLVLHVRPDRYRARAG